VVAAAVTEQRKRSRAAIIWSVLAVFLVVIAVLEFGDRSEQAGTVSPTAPKMLMPAPLEEIAAIEIAVDGNLHRFSRDDQNAWFYHGIHAGPQSVHEHVPDPEMSQKITKSLGGLGRARIERRFTLTEEDPFGVTRPEMIVLVYMPDQIEPQVRYSIGDIAPDELSRYVHVVGGPEVVSIANYQIRNLQNLIEMVSAQPESVAGEIN
jgi:hypothetical protein